LGDAEKILPQIPSESIDFILTDPPYFINEEVSIIRRGNTMKYKGKDIDFRAKTEWDRIWRTKEEYWSWILDILRELYRVLKPYRHLVLFCDKKDISQIGYGAEKIGFKFRTPFFLIKENPVPQARKVSPAKSVEMALWLTKGGVRSEFYNWQLGLHKDYIFVSIPQKEGSPLRHPTQKPLLAGLYLTALLSKKKDLCLDPFAGVFTFPLAFKLLGRRFLAIENNPEFFKAGEERLKNIYHPSVQKILNKFIAFMWERCKKMSFDEFLNFLGVNTLFSRQV